MKVGNQNEKNNIAIVNSISRDFRVKTENARGFIVERWIFRVSQ